IILLSTTSNFSVILLYVALHHLPSFPTRRSSDLFRSFQTTKRETMSPVFIFTIWAVDHSHNNAGPVRRGRREIIQDPLVYKRDGIHLTGRLWSDFFGSLDYWLCAHQCTARPWHSTSRQPLLHIRPMVMSYG